MYLGEKPQCLKKKPMKPQCLNFFFFFARKVLTYYC